jgi:hypothetical protein
VVSLSARREAVAAALRAVRAEPAAVPPPAYPDPVREPPAVASTPPAEPAAHDHPEMLALRADVRRLAERLERCEDKVDLIRDGDDAPLAWPVPVTTESRLEVPPLEVSRKSSPAFDVLLGASQKESRGRRDSA